MSSYIDELRDRIDSIEYDICKFESNLQEAEHDVIYYTCELRDAREQLANLMEQLETELDNKENIDE
jgi:uncharacterized coiled-coil DUF342 family protein